MYVHVVVDNEAAKNLYMKSCFVYEKWNLFIYYLFVLFIYYYLFFFYNYYLFVFCNYYLFVFLIIICYLVMCQNLTR
jgi:uncharacterized membrane protein